MVLRLCAVVAFVIGVTAASAAAPQPAEQVRSGTASVGGRITEAESKRPLGGVLVTLIAQDLRARLSTVTRPDGRYVFEGISPAPYIVEANDPDYVPARFVEAEPHPAKTQYLWVAPSSPHRTDVDLVLVPAGTINGRITDQQGRPLHGAMVTLMREVSERNFRMAGFQSMTRANRAGEYSLRQVAEGSYRISVFWIDPEAVKAKSSVRERPSYHPGTTDPLEAAIVLVARGETVNKHRRHLHSPGHGLSQRTRATPPERGPARDVPHRRSLIHARAPRGGRRRIQRNPSAARPLHHLGPRQDIRRH